MIMVKKNGQHAYPGEQPDEHQEAAAQFSKDDQVERKFRSDSDDISKHGEDRIIIRRFHIAVAHEKSAINKAQQQCRKVGTEWGKLK